MPPSHAGTCPRSHSLNCGSQFLAESCAIIHEPGPWWQMALALGGTTGWSAAAASLGQRQGVFGTGWRALGGWSDARCMSMCLRHVG